MTVLTQRVDGRVSWSTWYRSACCLQRHDVTHHRVSVSLSSVPRRHRTNKKLSITLSTQQLSLYPSLYTQSIHASHTTEQSLYILSPPGRHRDAAPESLMSFDNEWTKADCWLCCVKTVDEKLLRLKIWWTSVKGRCMATNFVAWYDHKLAFPAFIFCASIWQRLGRSQNLYPHGDRRWILYILSKFRELQFSKSLRCCGHFAGGWVDADMQKYARFRCFHHSL